jgi:2-keto-4-pentenoate hydratase
MGTSMLSPAGSRAPDPDALMQSAQSLLRAEQHGKRIPLLSSRFDASDLTTAYAIARKVHHLKGGAVGGYKLGYTSQAIRAQMGIFEPNFGRYPASAVLQADPDGIVRLTGLVHPRIEPEITLIMGEVLSGPGVTPKDVDNAIATAHLSFEIVDTRYTDYRFTAFDNIADNSSAARLLIGDHVSLAKLRSLSTAEATLFESDVLLQQCSETNLFATICQNVAWLVNRLAEDGESLDAGTFVMTGALTKAFPVGRGNAYRVEMPSLGMLNAIFKMEAVQ